MSLPFAPLSPSLPVQTQKFVMCCVCVVLYRFVMTGSDDTNLRIWKANASEKMGTVVPREARKQEYRNSLKKR